MSEKRWYIEKCYKKGDRVTKDWHPCTLVPSSKHGGIRVSSMAEGAVHRMMQRDEPLEFDTVFYRLENGILTEEQLAPFVCDKCQEEQDYEMSNMDGICKRCKTGNTFATPCCGCLGEVSRKDFSGCFLCDSIFCSKCKGKLILKLDGLPPVCTECAEKIQKKLVDART